MCLRHFKSTLIKICIKQCGFNYKGAVLNVYLVEFCLTILLQYSDFEWAKVVNKMET